MKKVRKAGSHRASRLYAAASAVAALFCALGCWRALAARSMRPSPVMLTATDARQGGGAFSNEAHGPVAVSVALHEEQQQEMRSPANLPAECRYPPRGSTLVEYGVPRHIWQTYENRRVPQQALQYMSRWRKWHPEWTMHFCNNTQRREVFEELGEPYLTAYDRLPLAVMKADLWRYAVLYLYGGVYADLDIEPRVPLDEWIVRMPAPMVMVAGEGNCCRDLFEQWFLVSSPGHPLYKTLLDMVVAAVGEGVDTSKDEEFVHQITGPSIWTRAVKEYIGWDGGRFRDTAQANKRPDLWLPKGLILLEPEAFRSRLVKHHFASDYWHSQRLGYVSWKVERSALFRDVKTGTSNSSSSSSGGSSSAEAADGSG